MKRYTVRVYDNTLIQRLETYLQSDVPQNTLLCRLIEQGLVHTRTDHDLLLQEIREIRAWLEQGIVLQEPGEEAPEPDLAAAGLDAMLTTFEKGER